MQEKKGFFKTYTGQLITFNIFVFVIMFTYNYYVEQKIDLSQKTLSQFGALHPHTSPWYSVITMMFLHGSIVHILFNSISLKTIGENLENVAKSWFLPVYFISGLVSGIAVYLYGNNWTVGASGAICGIWAMMTVYEIKYRENRKGPFVFLFTAIDLGLLIYVSSLPNISAIGHFSGFMSGLIFGLIYFNFFYKEEIKEEDKPFTFEKNKPENNSTSELQNSNIILK